jgi:hypothetical protein
MVVLAERYCAGHGPATIADFAWWSGLTMRAARGAIESAPSLERVGEDSPALWAVKRAPTPDLESSSHLLPRFDGYLLAYKDRTAVLDAAFNRQVNAGGGMPRPTFLLNGRVAGTWMRKKRGRRTVVSLEPFRRFGKKEVALVEAAVKRYAGFLETQVEIET